MHPSNVEAQLPGENRPVEILYNYPVPDTKPFRLTESVKAAG